MGFSGSRGFFAVNTASNDLADTSDTTEATGTDDAADAVKRNPPRHPVSA